MNDGINVLQLALNASLFESVAPGGRLAIIDFEPGGLVDWLGGGARRQGHGVRPAQVIRELTAAGFGLERRNDRWGRSGYLLTFRRPPPCTGSTKVSMPTLVRRPGRPAPISRSRLYRMPIGKL